MATSQFEEVELQNMLDKIAKDEGFKEPTYSITNASKPGQNFIGRVFRVVVKEKEREEKSLSLIFKASSTNRARQDMMGGDMLFRIEKDAYEIVLPTLNDFLRRHGVTDHPTFPGTPRCFATELNYASSTDKSDMIVLEDKSVEGFSVVDLRTGVDAVQCRLALERVALMHAAAMAFHDQDPDAAERMRKSLQHDYNLDDFKAGFADLKRGYEKGLEMLEEPYKPGNPTYDSLLKVLDNFEAEWFKRMECPQDIFSVAHNDFSSNNIMFKVDNEGLTHDACMIDFQTVGLTNFANDLSTILLFCTTKSVRDEHFENLIDFYFHEIRRILRRCGSDPEKLFPRDLYQKHLKAAMFTGARAGMFALPVLLADPLDIGVDMHKADGGAVMFANLIQVENRATIERVKRRLNDVIADCEKFGYI